MYAPKEVGWLGAVGDAVEGKNLGLLYWRYEVAFSRRDPATRCIGESRVVVDEGVTSKTSLPIDWPFCGWKFGLVEEDLHAL